MLVSPIQGSEIAQTTAKTASDTNKSVAAATTTIQPFYFSPALVIDPKSGTDVLEYRNTSTGAVINQYPSEKNLKAYSQTSTVAATSVAKPDVKTDVPPASTSTTAQQPQAVAATTAVVV